MHTGLNKINTRVILDLSVFTFGENDAGERTFHLACSGESTDIYSRLSPIDNKQLAELLSELSSIANSDYKGKVRVGNWYYAEKLKFTGLTDDGQIRVKSYLTGILFFGTR